MSGYFSELPDAIRLPFAYAEFDPSQADRALSEMAFHVLIAGQMLPGGTADPLTAVRPTTDAQADNFFGKGSMLAEMCKAYLAANPITKMSAIGILDAEAGVKATGSITFTGTVTKATPLCLYIGGKLVRTAAAKETTAASLATDVAAAINADGTLPVTATAAEGVVTLTAKHAGTCANDIDIRFSYYNEDFPQGIIPTVSNMTGGAGNPDVTNIIAALGGERYHVIAWPWTDQASLNPILNELDSRWSPLRQIDGQAIVVKTGSFSQVTTFTSTQNNKHLTVIPNEGSPTPPWVDSAACVGVVAYYGDDDPARPFQTLKVPGVLPPNIEQRWSDFPEKNQALYEGCSVRGVNAAGEVIFLNLITTYRVNDLGAETQAFLQLNTLFTLSYIRYDWNNYLKLKYPRHKLTSDDNAKLVRPGQPIITPSIGKAEAINRMHEWVRMGLVEAPEDFKSRLIVERDATNKNRLNWYMAPDLVNQFRVGATLIQYLL
jgi:phage tail sheath gpL-like